MNNTIKISELEETTQVSDNDLLVIVDVANNETKKVQAQYVGTGQGGAEIPISDTEPLDPEENDLWIDTSESEEMQEVIKNEYSESTTDTYSCDYINTYIDDRVSGVTLWTNSNPSNTFGNQTVQFNATDYDKFEVICRLSTSNDIRVCQTVYKGSEYRLMEVGYETNDNAFIRSVTITSSGASFGDCSGYGVGSNTQFTSTNNNALIPLEIKGFKAYIS